jgi:peptide/nickel transport system permease protein
MNLAYLVKRVISTLPVFWGIATIIFILMFMVPGDPARMLMGQRGDEETLTRIRGELGLDRPFLVQYGLFWNRLFHADLGQSYRQHRPVTQIIMERFPITLRLAAFAIVVALAFGMFAGVLAAIYRGRWVDYTTMAFSLAGVSIPIFWFGLMLIIVFSTWLGWFHTGYGDGGFRYIVLPGVSLSAVTMGTIARITRSSILEVLRADYVQTARAKGLPEIKVILKHVLRNALIPVVTVAGNHLAGLLTGAIATETIFAWPGLGRAVFEAIAMRDRPVVLGGVLFIAFIFVAVNFFVDILYSALDPKIQMDKAR